MFETSPSTDKLDEVLAKAQGDIGVAKFDSRNPHFKSPFASLGSVFEACRSALINNGISITQWPLTSNDQHVHMVTRLAYKGEWMRCVFSLPASKQDAQGYGSAITYLRRYTLAAALGIVADEDDDGNAAVATTAQKEIKNHAPGSKPTLNDPGEFKITFGQWAGKSLKQIPFQELSAHVKWIKENSIKTGRPVPDNMNEYILKVMEYGKAKQPDPFPEDEQLPF